MIKLKSLLYEADVQQPAAKPAPAADAATTPASQPSGQDSPNEYSPSFDFTDFERKIATSTETAKNNLQAKLLQQLGGKKVMVRASKGQPAQPKKDLTINVAGVSIDYYYDKYVVVLKDEKEKEYFLDTSMKIKIMGASEVKPISNKAASPASKPTVAPVEKNPNTATQGI
jgi:hypothetical protein